MRRALRIDLEILDPEEPKPLNTLTEAVADYVAREWNANVSAHIVYDSDDDPNYQRVWNPT